ncbi:hypothetical protein F4811DRAFT_214465 [Daldinia bambusicola]|nr:hypothetical protein F4811DRAFT_214465 [Daldinia bambusicola]
MHGWILSGFLLSVSFFFFLVSFFFLYASKLGLAGDGNSQLILMKKENGKKKLAKCNGTNRLEIINSDRSNASHIFFFHSFLSFPHPLFQQLQCTYVPISIHTKQPPPSHRHEKLSWTIPAKSLRVHTYIHILSAFARLGGTIQYEQLGNIWRTCVVFVHTCFKPLAYNAASIHTYYVVSILEDLMLIGASGLRVKVS